jgi:hypothetical protein
MKITPNKRIFPQRLQSQGDSGGLPKIFIEDGTSPYMQ